jgi:hypothetical protein
MPRRAVAWCVLSWTILAAAAGSAIGQVGANTEAEPVETAPGQPIHRGFVILDGQYLPPPYVVAQRGEDLLINGRPVATEGFAEWPWGRGMGRGPGFRMGPRRGGGRDMRLVASVERRLQNGGLLLGLDRDNVRFVSFGEDAVDIMEILISDDTNEAKVERLMGSSVRSVSSAQWAEFVENLKLTDKLVRRVRATAAQREQRTQEAMAAHQKAVTKATPRSEWMRYAITVTAMLLGVVALGSLLSHRPPGPFGWRELDRSPDAVSTVVRNVVLLVLLGLFDLASTVIARQAGGLWEINPLGHQLMESPAALAAFKLTALLASAAILLALRRYRGAQVASWWMCLVCTVLTFRWATFNSMFLT